MRSRSDSTSSNTSNKSKELSADNMAIQVNIGGGKSEFCLLTRLVTSSNLLTNFSSY